MKLEIATLGGGCFWCLEAIYQLVNGVVKVVSGYAGGEKINPTYREVCTGETGHAEVVQVYFDSDIISYSEILKIFWDIHNPTTLNRQGNDEGTQYRSIILYHNEEQKEIALQSKQEEQKNWSSPIVTEVLPFTVFYEAEDYHQNYYRSHPNAGYCYFVIRPKVEKFIKSRNIY